MLQYRVFNLFDKLYKIILELTPSYLVFSGIYQPTCYLFWFYLAICHFGLSAVCGQPLFDSSHVNHLSIYDASDSATFNSSCILSC